MAKLLRKSTPGFRISSGKVGMLASGYPETHVLRSLKDVPSLSGSMRSSKLEMGMADMKHKIMPSPSVLWCPELRKFNPDDGVRIRVTIRDTADSAGS